MKRTQGPAVLPDGPAAIPASQWREERPAPVSWALGKWQLWLQQPPGLQRVTVAIGAVAVALGLGALIIAGVGADPLVAYRALFYGAFGNLRNLSETLVKSAPILLIGLGVIIAYRASVFTIGGEGQLFMGALAAAWVGIRLTGLPPALHVFVAAAAAGLAGGLWGGLSGILKARWRVDEIITTLMLNYIAILFVDYVINGPLRDPISGGYAITPALQSSALWPTLLPGTRLHSGVLLAFLLAPLVSILLWKTTVGFRFRAVGANAEAARAGGIDVGRQIVAVMFLSGGLAGLAGMGEVAGVHGRLMSGISPGYGFTGIVVALLGGLSPLGAIPAAILFGGLIVGANLMARVAAVPVELVQIISGLVILLVIASEFLIGRRSASGVGMG